MYTRVRIYNRYAREASTSVGLLATCKATKKKNTTTCKWKNKCRARTFLKALADLPLPHLSLHMGRKKIFTFFGETFGRFKHCTYFCGVPQRYNTKTPLRGTWFSSRNTRFPTWNTRLSPRNTRIPPRNTRLSSRITGFSLWGTWWHLWSTKLKPL